MRVRRSKYSSLLLLNWLILQALSWKQKEYIYISFPTSLTKDALLSTAQQLWRRTHCCLQRNSSYEGRIAVYSATALTKDALLSTAQQLWRRTHCCLQRNSSDEGRIAVYSATTLTKEALLSIIVIDCVALPSPHRSQLRRLSLIQTLTAEKARPRPILYRLYNKGSRHYCP